MPAVRGAQNTHHRLEPRFFSLPTEILRCSFRVLISFTPIGKTATSRIALTTIRFLDAIKRRRLFIVLPARGLPIAQSVEAKVRNPRYVAFTCVYRFTYSHNFSLIVPRILSPTLLLSPTPVKSVRFATPAHLRTADPLTLAASGPLPPSPTREFPEVPCLSTARQFQLRHEY